MQLSTSLRRKVRIDITPLVDILFILLIFVMVTSTFLEAPGIKLELPAAHTSTPQPQRQLIVSLTAEGKLYLNNKPTTLSQLKTQLSEALRQKGATKTLIIKADRSVPYGRVVRVMDLAKLSGIQKLVITTKLPKP